LPKTVIDFPGGTGRKYAAIFEIVQGRNARQSRENKDKSNIARSSQLLVRTRLLSKVAEKSMTIHATNWLNSWELSLEIVIQLGAAEIGVESQQKRSAAGFRP
jgi:hypothetical protein